MAYIMSGSLFVVCHGLLASVRPSLASAAAKLVVTTWSVYYLLNNANLLGIRQLAQEQKSESTQPILWQVGYSGIRVGEAANPGPGI
eukprot:2105741-Karenia_brevis.AAC.1